MIKTIVELEPNECRWPMHREGKQHWFCGEPKAGKAYCAHHHAIAYAPTKPMYKHAAGTYRAETKWGFSHKAEPKFEKMDVPDCVEAFAGRVGE